MAYSPWEHLLKAHCLAEHLLDSIVGTPPSVLEQTSIAIENHESAFKKIRINPDVDWMSMIKIAIDNLRMYPKPCTTSRDCSEAKGCGTCPALPH
jgi:hypothetical protein